MKNVVLALLFLGVGLGIWAVRPWLAPSSTELPVVGELLEGDGLVETRSPRQTRWQTSSGRQALHHQEVIRTGAKSWVRVRLSTKMEIDILENSRVVAEIPLTAPQKLNLSILDGYAQIRQIGDRSRVYVYHGGKIIDPTDLQGPRPAILSAESSTDSLDPKGDGDDSQLARSSYLVATAVDEDYRPPIASNKRRRQGAPDSLSRDEISSRIRSQAAFIRKCYLGYVSRSQKQNASGLVVMGAVIQPNGKVQQAKTVKRAFGDPTFDRCLAEVFERTSFRNFDAKPIRVEYPIHFD